MTMTATKEVLSLKPLDKIRLVDKLLLSLDMPNKELDKIWAEESERRIDAYEAGRTQAQDVNEVLAKYSR